MKTSTCKRNVEVPVQRIIRLAELTEILGVSPSTVWRWRKSGVFPKPVSLGPKLVGWPSGIVSEWINGSNGGKENAGI